MVRIRLRRVGKKRQASYRVVIADSESPRDGRFIENIGFYNPRTEPATITIKADRALYWLSKGAQPSDAARRLLDKTGVLTQFAAVKGGKTIEEVLVGVEDAETEVVETVEEQVETETLAEVETKDEEPETEVVEAVEAEVVEAVEAEESEPEAE